MNRISHILSAVFTPLLLPTYGVGLALLVTQLRWLPEGTRWLTLAVTFALTCFLPLLGIMLMHKLGYVTDPYLNQRDERTTPYLMAVACYGMAALFFFRAGAPAWLPWFLVGGALAIVVNVVVNRRWKISAHAAGVGGFVALALRLAMHHAVVDMNLWLTFSIIVAGAVMSARVYLTRHTLGQVLAGCANGFLCVFLITLIH